MPESQILACIHVAYVVVTTSCQTVPISSADVEIMTGQKLSNFTPLIESANCAWKPTSASSTFKTGMCEATYSFNLAAEVNKVLCLLLSAKDKEKLRKVIFEFSDVFRLGIGFSDITSHKINTREHPPIKQLPGQLP